MCPTDWVRKNLNAVIFLDVIYVKLCMMVVIVGLYLYILVSMTFIIIKGQLKLGNVFLNKFVSNQVQTLSDAKK